MLYSRSSHDFSTVSLSSYKIFRWSTDRRAILTDDCDKGSLSDFASGVADHDLVLAVILRIRLRYLHLGLARSRRKRHLPVLTRLELHVVKKPRHGYRLWTGYFQHVFDLLELVNRLRHVQTHSSVLSSDGSLFVVRSAVFRRTNILCYRCNTVAEFEFAQKIRYCSS